MRTSIVLFMSQMYQIRIRMIKPLIANLNIAATSQQHCPSNVGPTPFASRAMIFYAFCVPLAGKHAADQARTGFRQYSAWQGKKGAGGGGGGGGGEGHLMLD